MNRWTIFLAAVILAAGLAGCGDDGTTKADPCGKTSAGYLPCNESPETVLHNLIVSYQRREIEEYAKLLDPEFRFYFQDGDEPPDLGRDYWTAAEDSTGTGALFNSPEVVGIFIDLTYGESIAGKVERLPEPVMWIRITPMKLTVDNVEGITYYVEGDIQDMFFRQGAGETSDRWYLYEWHDIPGGGGIGSPETTSAAIRGATWGQIKSQY